MSERHACRLMGLARSTHRYRERKAERDSELRQRLKELAAQAHALRLSPADGDAGARRDRRPITSACIGCIARKDWRCGSGNGGGSAGMER